MVKRREEPNPYFQGMKAPNSKDWQLPFGTPKRAPTLMADGTLRDDFKLDMTSVRPDSPWLTNQLEQNQNQYMQNQSNAYGNAMNQQQSGFNQLASSGGLSSGARERLTANTNQNLTNMNTGLADQSNQNVWGLKNQDYQNQVNADRYNIQNNLNQVGQQSAFDWNVFDTRASAYGAEMLSGGYEDRADESGDNGIPGLGGKSSKHTDPSGNGGVKGAFSKWRGDGWNDRDDGIFGKKTWDVSKW